MEREVFKLQDLERSPP